MYIAHRTKVLDPRYKLSYFRDAGWPEEWIKAAETLVRSAYEEDYMVIEDNDLDTPDIRLV